MSWERDEPDPYAEHARAGHKQCPACGECWTCGCSCQSFVRFDQRDDDPILPSRTAEEDHYAVASYDGRGIK